jgi:hypothetical protein
MAPGRSIVVLVLEIRVEHVNRMGGPEEDRSGGGSRTR